MSKVIDVRDSGGELVVLGRALVLPSSSTTGPDVPLNGSIRFNPTNAQIEMCFGGVWESLGGSGSGGTGATGPIPISDVVGLQTILNNKAEKIHVHAITEITGLSAMLAAKASVDHSHSIASIPNLQPTLDSLQTQVSSKSDINHQHPISAINGLQIALDSKATASHTHTISSIVGLSSTVDALKKERVAVCLPGSAPTGFTFAWTATQPVTFPVNFVGAFGSVLNAPAANYIITVSLHNGVVGTIRVNAGATNATFVASSAVLVSAGDALVFTCPTADANISTLSFTIVGGLA